MKKKIVALSGGIGNQMFQYCFARMLEQEKRCEIELDTGFYKNNHDRKIELINYNVKDYILREHALYNHILRVFQRIPLLRWIARTYKEYNQFELDYRVFKYDYRFYYGYWQNKEYFCGLKEDLLGELQYIGNITINESKMMERIGSGNSIAVHIRRGDYLRGDCRSLYCHLDKSYYIKAIDRACREIGIHDAKDSELFFFSDDTKYCRDLFQDYSNAIFVDSRISSSQHIDLILMKKARCLVMSNSTFSWWAAWLSERSDKIIVMPDRWYQDSDVNAKAIKALADNNWILETAQWY